MPELPEVETVARQLAPLLSGQLIRRAVILDPKLELIAPAELAGRRVAGVRRIGKQIGIELVDPAGRRPSRWLIVHLRMTGRLIWSERADRPAAPPLRARLRLERGVLDFVDVRRFGTLRLVDAPEQAGPAGLDPLEREFTARALAALLARSRTPIKTWLLRQDCIVGLGNIYASEALHEAGIDPRRPACQLDAEEISRLVRAIRATLRRAIAANGTTFSDFQDSRGLEGGYGRYLRVYAREGQPCPRCGSPVERLIQQQRSTFYCPVCQR